MKKNQHQIELTISLQAASRKDQMIDKNSSSLPIECQIVIQQGKKGNYKLHADLVIPETPFTKKLIRQLDWLDWPL